VKLRSYRINLSFECAACLSTDAGHKSGFVGCDVRFRDCERLYMDAYMDASDFARETLCDGVGTAATLYSAFFPELNSAGPDEIR